MNDEIQLDFLFEEGIPEVVYGDMTKFRQLIFIILKYSVSEQVNDVPTTAFVRFAEFDSLRRYNIECKFEIPFTQHRISAQLLKAVFTNNKLGLNFFLEFKDELHKYDLGLLI